MAQEGLVKITFGEEQRVSPLQNFRNVILGLHRSLPAILSRAVNRTASDGSTQVAREISDVTTLKPDDITAGIVLTKATLTHWEAQLGISAVRIPLIRFDAQQETVGVSYVIDGRSGRQTIGAAFLATMSGDDRGVFKRRSALRLPIFELFGPSLSKLFEKTPGIADELLEKNILIQVDAVLKRGRVA